MSTEIDSDDLATFREWLSKAKKAVFFGGAGVSTASGIPDFRSSAGLYVQQGGTGLAPEYLLSHTCLVEQPEEFFKFYRESLLHPEAKPNGAHLALAELEKRGNLAAVVTQNIDGLHQAAGSKTVWELHGTELSNHCSRGHQYSMEWVLETTGIPKCPEDQTTVRPDVVLYEESLPEDQVLGAIDAIQAADLMIIGGTSLAVYPAAGLLNYFKGEHVVLINRDETPADKRADLIFREPIADVLTQAL